MKDLFEDIKQKIGCLYISDIKFGYYKRMATKTALKLIENEYELSQWDDFVSYVYEDNIKFDSKQEVLLYLNEKLGL